MGNSESTVNNTDWGKSESKPNWTNIAFAVAVAVANAVAAVVTRGLYSVLSRSSPVPVPNSDPGSGGVPSSSSSASAGDSDSVAGWQFPPKGWVKCNVDGYFLPSELSAGCGGVYRDEQGNWLYGFAKNIDYYDTTMAETFAIYTGLTEACRLGYKKVVIESDSRSAVDLVNKRSSTSDQSLADLVNQVMDYVNKHYWEVEIVNIPEKCNEVADRLAGLSHELQVGVLKEYKGPPQACIDFLSDGVSGKTEMNLKREH